MSANDTTRRPALEPSSLEPHGARAIQAVETRLARVYGLGLSAGASVFVIGLLLSAFGLLIPWVFWAGIGVLVLVPGIAAAQSALDAMRSGDTEIFRSILLTAAGLLLAVVLGVLISRR